jgi:hypothetical protein
MQRLTDTTKNLNEVWLGNIKKQGHSKKEKHKNNLIKNAADISSCSKQTATTYAFK